MSNKKQWNSRIESVEDLNMWRRTGQVAGSKFWSDSRTKQDSYYGGRVTSVVYTQIEEHNRFFIREKNGREIEINDAPINVRDGQYVTVIYVGHKSEDIAWPVYYYNHNIEKQGVGESVLKAKTAGQSLAHTIAGILVLIVIGLLFITDGSLVSFLGGLIFCWGPAVLVGVSYFRNLQRTKAVKKEIEQQTQALLDEAKASVGPLIAEAANRSA